MIDLKCDHCSLRCFDVKEMLDPYEMEIHKKEVEVKLCEDCWDYRCKQK